MVLHSIIIGYTSCTSRFVSSAAEDSTFNSTPLSSFTSSQSVLVVWQLVEDLCQLMQDLPLYSTHFLSILCQLLLVYRDSCNTLYRGKEGGREEGRKGLPVH